MMKKNGQNGLNSNDDDYDSSSDDSEKENDEKKDIDHKIDFHEIKSRLQGTLWISFKKKDLPLFENELNLKQTNTVVDEKIWKEWF